jgi:hypothetical protein
LLHRNYNLQKRNISGTWIITSGLNNGAARLIGEGIGRLRALTDTKESTTLLRISWWGNVTEKTRRMVLETQREVNNYSTKFVY